MIDFTVTKGAKEKIMMKTLAVIQRGGRFKISIVYGLNLAAQLTLGIFSSPYHLLHKIDTVTFEGEVAETIR